MESKMYKLFELKDSLEAAIKNAEKLLTEQGYLVKSLKLSVDKLENEEEKKSITTLINQLEKQNIKIAEKIESMQTRAKYTDEILFIYNQGYLKNAKEAQKAGSKFIDEIMSKALIALGLEKEKDEESVTEE